MGSKYHRPANRKAQSSQLAEVKDEVVTINRVAKVVKGGRRFSFSALVVSGDGNGHIGYGLGKANEVPEAIRKGAEAAKKAMINVPLVGNTFPYEVIGHGGASRVMLKPASPGTGVIAGSAVRKVIELLGVQDVLTKSFGSQNPHNILAAVFDGLLQLELPDVIASRRGKQLDDLDYRVYG